MGGAPTVLVVDDDASMLAFVEAVLQRDGMNTIPCDAPQTAAALALEHHPDAVILDILMPGTSGFEVLERLRQQAATHDIPVLFLSVMHAGPDRIRGLRAGADDYLTKPFEPEELSIRLKRLIDRSRSDSSVVLSGRLGRLAVGDILQQALTSGLTGVLQFDGTPRGSISVVHGEIASAQYGDLKGESALLALLDQRQGSFRLLEMGSEDAPPPASLSLTGALMQLAWLEDEIERHRQLLPPGDLPLKADEGASLPESECRQIGQVFDWFRRNPGASLDQLEQAAIAAPQQARLATLLLVDAKALRPLNNDWQETESPRNTEGPPTGTRLEAACLALARSAVDTGRPSDVLHVLIGVDPHRWNPFLHEFVSAIPQSLVERSRDAITDELHQHGSASLRISFTDTTLLLHIHQLTGLSGLRARAFLAMATALVLVPSGTPNTQTLEIIETVANAQHPPRTLLVPPPEGIAEDHAGVSAWRISERVPASLEELLELLV